MSRVHIRRSEQPTDTSTTEAKTERGFAAGGGDQGQLLASALSWNMIFSAANGVVLLAGSPVLDSWFGVSAWLLGGTGAGLLLFAGSLLWLLAGTRHLAWGARAVIGADLGWVAGASVLLLAFPDLFSLAGRLVLVAVTAVVVVVAAAQFVGLRRAGPGPLTGAIPITLTVERILAAPPERVWAAVADAGDYARFAPGIASTEIVSGEGDGMVRVCTDDHGGQWAAETCTLWEEGRRYRMTVDVLPAGDARHLRRHGAPAVALGRRSAGCPPRSAAARRGVHRRHRLGSTGRRVRLAASRDA